MPKKNIPGSNFSWLNLKITQRPDKSVNIVQFTHLYKGNGDNDDNSLIIDHTHIHTFIHMKCMLAIHYNTKCRRSK